MSTGAACHLDFFDAPRDRVPEQAVAQVPLDHAFAARDAQHLLIKAPPASGKSRALMFLALDKMHKQGVAKTIVAVPERSIGSSFASTKLSEFGFHSDWDVEPV